MGDMQSNWKSGLLLLTAAVLGMLISASTYADQEAGLPRTATLPPLMAQQELSELVRAVQQATAEMAARESALSRLKAESEKVKVATEPKATRENAKRLASQLNALPHTKEGLQISRAQATTLINSIRTIIDSIWAAFPGIDEIAKLSSSNRYPLPGATEDLYLAQVGRAFEDAMYDTPPIRALSDLRRVFETIDPSTKTTVVPLESIPDFVSILDNNYFPTIQQAILNTISAESSRLEARFTQLQSKLKAMQQRQSQLQDSIEEGQSQIDKKIIQWGLPAFGLVLLAIFAIPKLYRDKELQAEIFSSGIVLDMFTVFLLTITILLLGLGRKLTENVLGTLLGGIAGYVLGRSTAGRATRVNSRTDKEHGEA